MAERRGRPHRRRQGGLGHYQFETLHPFSDGNGRLGRLIVVLQLVQDDVLTYPVINLSQWFEPRKERYKDLLRGVSETGQYDAWVQFFCEAVVTQSNEMVDRIEKLLDLRVEMLGMLRAHKVRGVAVDIVEDLIGFPIITPPEAAQRHSVTFPPASAAMKRLESLGILREITGASYGRIYLCERVLQTLDPQPLEL